MAHFPGGGGGTSADFEGSTPETVTMQHDNFKRPKIKVTKFGEEWDKFSPKCQGEEELSCGNRPVAVPLETGHHLQGCSEKKGALDGDLPIEGSPCECSHKEVKMGPNGRACSDNCPFIFKSMVKS